MCRLKIREVTFKETDIDLPVYLAYESDGLRSEYIKWDGYVCTRVIFDWDDVSVSSSDTFYGEESNLRNISTEEVFEEAFEGALKIIKDRL